MCKDMGGKGQSHFGRVVGGVTSWDGLARGGGRGQRVLRW